MIRYGSKKDFNDLFPIRLEAQEYYNELAGEETKVSKELMTKEFNHALSQKGVLLVAEEKGQIIGFLTATIIDNISKLIGYIDDLAVKKEYRNKGYAQQLINKFEEELKKKNIKHMSLGVKPNNKRAINLYKKLGFSIEYYEMQKEI